MISHQWKCLSVHIPKTGGNSINKVFGVDWSSHTDIRKYKEDEPDEVFENYFKFAVVRNPWSRLLADYNFQRRKSRGEKLLIFNKEGKKRKFADWVEAVFDDPYQCKPSSWGGKVSEGIHRWSPQMEWLAIDGKIATDLVVKLERIDEDFAKVSRALGMEPVKLPKKNSRFHFHYSRYYNDKLIEKVGEYYKADIDAFGYSFGD